MVSTFRKEVLGLEANPPSFGGFTKYTYKGAVSFRLSNQELPVESEHDEKDHPLLLTRSGFSEQADETDCSASKSGSESRDRSCCVDGMNRRLG